MEKTSKELLKEFINSQHFTSTKPIVGINLLKNRIHAPQIFSTQKWT